MGIYIPDTFSSVGDAVVTGATGLLLNQYPGAVAAFDLRKINSSYSGPCIRVKRTSDNAEQNIGFDVNNELDTAAIASFCFATNGFVITWYDQSGNGNNAIFTTASSQPKIYDSLTGQIVAQMNGKPAIFCDGSAWLQTANLTGVEFANGYSYFAVFEDASFNKYCFYVGTAATSNGIALWANTGGLGYHQNFTLFTYPFLRNDNQGLLQSAFYDGYSSLQLYCHFENETQNFGNNAVPSLSSTSAGVPLTVFAGIEGGNVVKAVQGRQQSIIIYNSNQIANRINIEANINDYYQIYTPYIQYIYQLDEFNASGTWTKPANSIYHEVVIIGAGGGGASGSKQASGTVSQGGSSGSNGAVSMRSYVSSALGSTESITIGAGGAGGAAVTNNSTNGTSGGTGGTTSFGTLQSVDGAGGASYNTGGARVTWVSGTTPSANPAVFAWNGGVNSAAGGGNALNGEVSSISSVLSFIPRSPAGGGISLTLSGVGGLGSRFYNRTGGLNTAALVGAINTGAPSSNGVSNWSDNLSCSPLMFQNNPGTMHFGASGGSGSASNAGPAGNAGDSGNYGCGGAGGGASQNGSGRDSGKGGNAGQGCVKILSVIIPT